MYRTCCMPGCTVGFERCRIHHVTFWEQSGLTDLDNLVPICELHHHLVHEGGWTLQLQPGRRIVLHRPDGTLSYDGITTDRITASTITFCDADTEDTPPTPTPPPCQRKRPPPTSAAEVAEELELALHEIQVNAP